MDPYSNLPFQDKEYYEALGLKAGLEVHQQLLTDRKLFCRCPAGMYSNEFHAEILRHMRPTLSELGEYDGTALMEYRTRKNIIYRLNNKTVCTYEMDDSPPFHINKDAVAIALEIAMLLECNIVSEIHIARKQYLDGSIPTGFQRTTVVGLDGIIPVGGEPVHVVQLGLEEDACREVEDKGHRRVYKTDRLGMPLIEVVTEPELTTPIKAYQAAQSIRCVTRSTGMVRTGIGAARQDVNVSIKGGTRVEIKGVSRIPRIPYLVHFEAVRQKYLLEIKNELRRRKYKKDAVKPVRKSVASIMERSGFQPALDAVHKGNDVAVARLDGFRGLLNREIQPGRFLFDEFSDRVRVVACLDDLPNIACSDHTGKEISSDIWKEVLAAADAGPDDAAVIVWGEAEDLLTALEEIESRAREAFDGVPSETRRACADNTNGFERILPGPDRMYPDTDLPPKIIPREQLESLKKKLTLTAAKWEKASRKFNMSSHLRSGLYRHGYAGLFLEIMRSGGRNASFAASMLVDKIAARKKKGFTVPSEVEIRTVFSAFGSGTISKDEIKLWAGGRAGKGRSRKFGRPDQNSQAGSIKILSCKVEHLVSNEKPRCASTRGIMNYYIGRVKEKYGNWLPGKNIYDILAKVISSQSASAE